MILLSTLVLTTCLLSHWIGFDPYLIIKKVQGGCKSFDMEDNSVGGRAVDSVSGSDNWQKYLNLSEENNSTASPLPRRPLFSEDFLTCPLHQTLGRKCNKGALLIPFPKRIYGIHLLRRLQPQAVATTLTWRIILSEEGRWIQCRGRIIGKSTSTYPRKMTPPHHLSPVVFFFQRTFGHVPCTRPWGGSATSEPYSFHFPNGSMEFTFLAGSNPRSG
ncbi:hypothetical protein KY285_024008 [Solanum tuberosum]|nr:hypothetical protein KY289_024365 [Solanum tuberosum]KAH0676207.1 hypothetical protein KY285_024008 [Solanum tuberosum]